MNGREIDRYDEVAKIVTGARELIGGDLAAYLDEACGDDKTLWAEAEELLRLAREEGADDPFSEQSMGQARKALETLVDGSISAWLPENIGSYRIVRQIGEGGMGVVYEAKQESPQRSVAIKILHPVHATEDRLRRFRHEAELLGRLQHPGIAQIFEAGTYDVGRGPQPFIAMELVRGADIRTHCRREGLDKRARIELLAQVADGVQYAHDHGVVHRDLKPGNVLVNDECRPVILDFGIARATDDTTPLSTAFTKTGQLVGTLAYMAPEQLHQSRDAWTEKVDVYALGVLGFELLVGQLPREVGELTVVRAIASLAGSDAPPAGKFDTSLKGDIETILGKALETDADRRYPSAAALARDLRRHLADQPIEARAPSRVYLVRKFVRRHRALVGGTVATLLVAIIGAMVAISLAIQSSRHADESDRRAAAGERASYLAGIGAANGDVQQQHYTAASDSLDRTPKAHRGWEYDYLRARLVHFDREWSSAVPLISSPVLGREGTRVLALGSNGSIRAWDTQTGEPLAATPPAEGWPRQREFRHAAVHAASLRFALGHPSGGLVIGHLDGRTESRVIRPFTDGDVEPFKTLGAMEWDASGERLLYVVGRDLHLWDGSEHRLLFEHRHGSPGGGVPAFSHSGDRVFFARGIKLFLLDSATGSILAERRFEDSATSAAFSPDDQTIAVLGVYRNVHLLDARSLESRRRLVGHQDVVSGVAWDSDGSQLATISRDGTLRIWRPRSDAPPTTLTTGFVGGGAGLTFTPDGRSVLVAGNVVRRFPVESTAVLRGHESYVYHVAFSPDGTLLASAGLNDRDVFVWDIGRGQLRRRVKGPDERRVFGSFGPTPLLAFSADGRRLVAASADHVVNWDVDSGEQLPASTHENPNLRYFETVGRRVDPNGTPVSADLTRFAVRSSADGAVSIFEHPRLAYPRRFDSEPPGMFTEHDPRMIDRSANPLGSLRGHIGAVYAVAFSPDGTRIATGGNDETVRIWDAKTLEETLVLRGHEQYVMALAFSPDGSLLASGSGDGTIRLWDTKPLIESRALVGPR